ncbi:hypothetical protein [Nannocystis pusilla]|uniref:hypothetical protein n=1 Tax=Nannocystis pusilla TaxID=889268 RepID=UPI003DA5B735
MLQRLVGASLALVIGSSTLGCGSDSPAVETDAGPTGATGSDTTTGEPSATTTGEPPTTGGPTVPTSGGEDTDGPAVCGDGVVGGGEACDDGNDTPDDACTNDCMLPACGDGLIQAGEECDAGAQNGANAACLDDCSVNVCGDGFVGPGEGCDDGNQVDADACGNDCAPASCGDGVVDADLGEQCDDGDDDDADACLHTCVAASCGDGAVQTQDDEGQPLPPGTAEECDDGPLNSDSAACLGSCRLAICGDGLVHLGVEACDNGGDNGPQGACLADCQDNVCGDGHQGPVEACDDGNASDDDGCSAACELEACGDGVVQAGEACDDGKNGDDDDGCTDLCKLEACGDGILQSGEACDDGNLNTNSGACTLACTAATCGDGWVWVNHEACDDGPANADDAACTASCEVASCGDGLLGPGEGCDDGNNTPADGCGATCISEECGNAIVDPGEACDDGNDDDDDACTNACTIPLPCDGPHVSKDTCVPAKQCGTVSRPWCSIGAALAASATSPIKVAAAGTAYFERVTMKDGYAVLGGYEPTFAGPRDANPATNGTVIRYTDRVVEWLPARTATLDGFTVRSEPINPSPNTFAVVSIAGSAAATLNGVRVEPTVPMTSYGTNTYGILVSGGSGGLTMLGPTSSVAGPRGSKSVGLGVVMGAELAGLTVAGTIQGGTGGTSLGIEHLGLGDLTITGGTVAGNTATSTATGVLVGRAGYGMTTLTGANVHSGDAPTAIAIDHRAAEKLVIEGGTITGGGYAQAQSVAIGLLTDGVGQTVIDGLYALGSDLGGNTRMKSAAAIELRNTAIAPISASIAGVTVDGGGPATDVAGIRTVGVPLHVTGSTITGTTSSNSSIARGIHVTGAFPPGSAVSIDNNPDIAGGVLTGNVGTFTHAVAVTTAQPVAVTDNTRIIGAPSPHAFGAVGVNLQNAGPGHVIAGNELVAGGSALQTFTSSNIGVSILKSAALVEHNQLVAGNIDVAKRANDAYGISVREGDLTARHNGRIMGGHAYTMNSFAYAAGVYVRGSLDHTCQLVLEDNEIVGGATNTASVYGILIVRFTRAIVQRNAVFVCPFAGDDPLCASGDSNALRTVGNYDSLYANNWFFGGYKGNNLEACYIGCSGGLEETCYKSDAAHLRFDSNLCWIEKGAAMHLEDYQDVNAPPPLLVNNIFHVASTAGTAVVHKNTFNGGVVLRNNDLVSGGQCLLAQINTNTCAKTAAEVDAVDGVQFVQASGNVSIEPSYVNPVVNQPTVAGFHLDASCALEDLALVSPVVTSDYDGDPRGDGVSSSPEIGPDECL